MGPAGRDGRRSILNYLQQSVGPLAAGSFRVLVVAKEGALRARGKDSLLQSDTLKSERCGVWVGRERGDYDGFVRI